MLGKIGGSSGRIGFRLHVQMASCTSATNRRLGSPATGMIANELTTYRIVSIAERRQIIVYMLF